MTEMFIYGMCAGMIVCYLVCRYAFKEQTDSIRNQLQETLSAWERESRETEEQIRTMRTTIKALNEDNVKLRKRLRNDAN